MLNWIYNYIKDLERKEKINFFEKAILAFFLFAAKIIKATQKHKAMSRLFLEARSCARKMTGRNYRFFSMEDAFLLSQNMIRKLSSCEIDVVIGIPRSGLMVASLVALKLGKPLSTPDTFIEGKVWRSKKIDGKEKPVNVLLIEDVVHQGRALAESLEALKQYQASLKITKAALLVYSQTKHLVDIYEEVIGTHTMLEWAFLHHRLSLNTAFDLEGVLCEKVPEGCDDHEEKYARWIKDAKAYLIPVYEVDCIVSSRLEKYRPETEAWLKKNGVKYKELILWDVPSNKDRKNLFSKYKIDILTRLQPKLYIESSNEVSKDIWQATKIPVLCADEMMMYS